VRLADLQELFWDEATRPEREARPETRAAFVSDARLDAAGRMAIYADAYRSRLVDILRADFPVTARTLGEERFDEIAGAFVREGPSVDGDVSRLASRFAPWVREHAPAWADDLARLEAARVAVFGAADDVPLALGDLQALADDEWPTLRLSLVAATARIDTQHAVAEYWSATPPAREPSRDAEQYLVWRVGFGPGVDHRRLDPLEAILLEGTALGETFASLCERAAATVGDDSAAEQTAGWLLRWVRDGIVRRAG
jgi:hypothetical protein